MEFTFGGRNLELTPEEVIAKLSGVSPEPLREHLVEIGGRRFPPKQAIALLTGWDRQTYTTYEARRVLQRLGFDCRRVGEDGGGGSSSGPVVAVGSDEFGRDLEDRLTIAEAQLAIAQLAVAELSGRVERLERRR